MRLVRVYQRCLERKRPRGCYRRVDRRCNEDAGEEFIDN
jgi:hypothetical protein